MIKDELLSIFYSSVQLLPETLGGWALSILGFLIFGFILGKILKMIKNKSNSPNNPINTNNNNKSLKDDKERLPFANKNEKMEEVK